MSMGESDTGRTPKTAADMVTELLRMTREESDYLELSALHLQYQIATMFLITDIEQAQLPISERTQKEFDALVDARRRIEPNDRYRAKEAREAFEKSMWYAYETLVFAVFPPQGLSRLGARVAGMFGGPLLSNEMSDGAILKTINHLSVDLSVGPSGFRDALTHHACKSLDQRCDAMRAAFDALGSVVNSRKGSATEKSEQAVAAFRQKDAKLRAMWAGQP